MCILSVHLPRAIDRIAVAFCFLSFGIWELIAPTTWITYVPSEFTVVLPAATLVLVHGIALSVVGLAVLMGFFPRLFILLATLLLLEVSTTIWFQEGFSDVFIRDLTLLFFTVVLTVRTFAGEE